MPRKPKDRPECYDCMIWEMPTEKPQHSDLTSIAQMVCRDYSSMRTKTCRVEFYPYTSLKSTVRIERGEVLLRLSDVLDDAPETILEALMHVLLARACRKKPRSEYVERYHDYLNRPEVEERHKEIRFQRTRKKIVGPAGRYHDLNESFRRINKTYFHGSIPKPTLTWSVKRSRRQLGYHDGHLNLIVISRWLDRVTVPQYVVDFIMYHEMLHIVLPTEYKNGRRVVHTPEFKQQEKAFQYYEEATRWFRKH